jgi:outer membrane receptor protein involved in Fe transport
MFNFRNFTALALFIGFTTVQADVEEVIVTANKKEETVQDIPMNISVITDVDIQERGISTPEDFLRSLAGVTTPGGSRYFTFRGLNTSSAQRSSGTTSTYVDEVPGEVMNIFDIERIEVLRGPQGTLYGSNAVGGTIRYITKMPDASGFDYSYQLEYGKKKYAPNSAVSYNAMVNVPLNDNLAVRATYSKSLDPGIYQNVMTMDMGVGDQDDERYVITLGYENDAPRFHDGKVTSMVRYIVNDRHDEGMKEKGNGDKPGNADINSADCGPEADFWYNYMDQPNSCRVRGIANSLGRDWSQFNPLLAFAEVTDEIHNVVTTSLVSTTSVESEYFTTTVITMDSDYDEDSDTEWSRIDMDDLYSGPLVVTSDDETEIREIRLTSNPGMVEWTLGYYDYKSKADPNSVVETQYGSSADAYDYIANVIMGWTGPDGSAYCPPYCEGDLGYPYIYYGSYTYYNYSEEQALYGQVALNLDKWTFTAGFRDYEIADGFKSSEFGVFYGGSFGCDGTAPEGTTCSEENGSESDNRPKFTATYQPNENLTLFAVSSAGYRPGGNNAALPYFCANDPEASSFQRRYTSDRAENTEFGVKARGDSFNVNATYFMIDWTDIQIGIAPACGWSFQANGGEAETSGVELDFSFALTDSLYVDFAGSFMSAETSVDMPSFGAVAGDRLPGSVEEQYNVGLSYEFVYDSKPSYARMDMLHYGDSYATFAQDKSMMAPSYTKFNVNVGMELNENSSLQLVVDNLFDNRTQAFVYAINSPSWRPRDYQQWIPPRTIGLRYTYRY